MIRTCAVLFAITVAALLAAQPGAAGTQKWYAKAVKKVEAKVTPAEAKPGQTVTFALTVELNDGYHTYPFVQPDPKADGMTNAIKFPTADKLVFVGKPEDPKGFVTKKPYYRVTPQPNLPD